MDAAHARQPVKSNSVSQELAPARTRGRTQIEDEVVSVISRIAAEQVQGIHKIGESALRGVFAKRTHGVTSEVGTKEAAIDIEIVIEFGFPIRDVAEDLREQVINSVETMTGTRVVEVNVFVVDVYIPRTERRHRRDLE